MKPSEIIIRKVNQGKRPTQTNACFWIMAILEYLDEQAANGEANGK